MGHCHGSSEMNHDAVMHKTPQHFLEVLCGVSNRSINHEGNQLIIDRVLNLRSQERYMKQIICKLEAII